MKFISRSSVGVSIGCVNILGFTITIIYIIKILYDFGQLTDEDKRDNVNVWSDTVTLLYIILIICVVAIIISSLLIAGIIKRRQLLMKPWIFCAFAGIVCHAFRLIVGFFSGFISGDEIIFPFVVGSLTLAVQLLIFYPIYKLYKDIQNKGNVTEIEREDTALNPNNENPPSYGDLERNGELYK